MNYEETYEQVNAIFTKVKALDANKKMQLRRAYGIDFEELKGYQQIIVKNILKDTAWGYSRNMRNFIVDMCAMYIKQGCENGTSFEKCLKNIYDNGSAATQQKIGYLVDEDDKLVLIRYVEKYVKMCSKNTNINLIKLTTDILCWPYYKTRDTWIDVIAGIEKEKEEEEKK